MKVQMLRGPNGQPEYAVLSIEDFNRLAQGHIEIDEDGEVWESLPYEADGYDDVCLPHEVVALIIEKNISRLAAWRLYRGLTQAEAARRAGISQAALSQMEKGKPQAATRELFAAIYACTPEQLAG